MKKLHIFILLISFIAIACSHHSGERNPASVKTEKETTHEKFQGAFDRQY